MNIGDVPFGQLKIGDKVISCTGKPGRIAGIYPVGTTCPFGCKWDDWNGGILFLWTEQTYSIAGYSDLTVQYLGDGN